MSERELSTRQAAILEVVVRAYTASGGAVSSGDVAHLLEPIVSSATVRNDMMLLTEEGYLTQPHTSAGRIPTAEGFRIVTERLLARESPRQAQDKPVVADVGYAAHHLANKTRAAAFVAMRGQFRTAGFAFVLTAPELMGEEGALESLAAIMDTLPMWSEQIRGALCAPLGIFIAEENPIMPSRHFSIVAAELPNGGVAAVLGPIRMRYDVAIRSLMAL